MGIVYRQKLKYGFIFVLGHCGDWPASQIWGVKSYKKQQMYYSFLFLIRESTNLHNLPLQIDNVNLYQPTFDKIMCTWIYYWGKNDHFWCYPPSDGRMRYFLGMFNTLRPISLFLRVNNEGLCDGTKVRGIVLLAISFFRFLEWRKNRHNIINFLNT